MYNRVYLSFRNEQTCVVLTIFLSLCSPMFFKEKPDKRPYSCQFLLKMFDAVYVEFSG